MMKEQNKHELAGVMLDQKKATIIFHLAGQEKGEFSIAETIETPDILKGGSEKAMNNSKQHDQVKFFKSIATMLLPFDEIYVFGPGVAQEQFKNYLSEEPQFKNKTVTIGTADPHQLSEGQMVAQVRDYFKSKQA